MRDPSRLLIIPIAVCGYSLTFVIAQQTGLKGNALLMVTVFLGLPASFLVAAVVGALLATLFPMPLEIDPGLGLNDGCILHIDSPPKLRKGQE
jgi:hypothetical protein